MLAFGAGVAGSRTDGASAALLQRAVRPRRQAALLPRSSPPAITLHLCAHGPPRSGGARTPRLPGSAGRPRTRLCAEDDERDGSVGVGDGGKGEKDDGAARAEHSAVTRLPRTREELVAVMRELLGALGWLGGAVRRTLGRRPAVFVAGMFSGLLVAVALVLVPDAEVVVIGGGGAGGAAGGAASTVGATTLREKSALFDLILQDVSNYYVEPVNVERLFETGVNAMLGSLDPYTQFENLAEAREMNLRTLGRYGGVGLGISPDVRDEQRLVVVSAFEGYAFDAGLRPGDYIEAVDGQSVRGKSIEAVTDMLRGSPGTSVDVRVAREGAAAPLDFRLDRRFVNLRDVPVVAMLDASNGIGYVRLQSFAKDASRELRAAVERLQNHPERFGAPKLNGLVLDLRGNPGGLLTSAVEVAEVFVPEGAEIVTTKGRALGDQQSYRSSRAPSLRRDVRMAVLVNGQTASAAEIVAGDIQDLDLGLIVGTRTFGKGLIQNIQELPFRTALRFTVGRYYTPSGRCIQALDYSSTSGTLTAREHANRMNFKTVNGRTVRDGGGIEVDVLSPSPAASELENALAKQGTFFYFANHYAAKVGRQLGKDFTVTDDIYRSFVDFADSGDFHYESRFDEPLAKLQELFKEEGYSGANKEMTELRAHITAEMRTNFLRHQKDIARRLESTIRSRVQPDSARLLAEVGKDEQVQQAVDLLKDRTLYAQLLQPTTSAPTPHSVADNSSPRVSSSVLELPTADRSAP